MASNLGLHQIGVGELKLDPENPRLPERLKGAPDREILNWMLTDATLADLMASIAENGFFGGEALIGIHDEADGKIIIVEGNRRLASVKVLHNPNLVDSKIKTVRELADDTTKNNNLPAFLPVYIVKDRDEVANYLGFRHVSGVKQWPVIAKARYLFVLYSNRVWSADIYRQLAKEIGSKSVYVRRLIIGFQLFQRIQEHNFYDLDYLTEENFDLSPINDAATKHGAISAYMGVKLDSERALDSLIERNFRNVFRWLYERDKDGETKIGESRNLPVLNKILSTEEAKFAFVEENYSLEDAAALTALADDNIRWHLQNARASMIEAQKLVHKIKSPNRSDVRLLNEIISSAETIKREISLKLIDAENS